MADNTSPSQEIELKLFASSSSNSSIRNIDTTNGENENLVNGNDSISSNQARVFIVGDGPSSLVIDDEKLNFSCSDENSNNDFCIGAMSSIGMVANSSNDDLTGEEPSFNIRLIEAVRQSRCLYDASDRQYRSADHKIKVWNRLVQVLGFQGDARTLYNRWKQLRDKYGKEKKKMKYNGDISQWQLYKHLEFLDPHMVDRTQQKYERTKDGKFIFKEMSRPIVITDPNFASNLVNEVRLRPCLFDIKDSKYRQTEYRNQVWAEIIKSLNFSGDINAIYKQWKKIRDRYVREKRKMRMSSNGDQEEPTWDLFRDLLWIDPYLEERAAQVKRKRASSELSDELFLDDFGMSGRMSDSHTQQQQQYTMVMPAAPMNPNETLQQLTKLHTQQPTTSGLQAPINTRQIRATAAPPLPGSTTTILANGTRLIMQPVLAASSTQLAQAQPGPPSALPAHHHSLNAPPPSLLHHTHQQHPQQQPLSHSSLQVQPHQQLISQQLSNQIQPHQLQQQQHVIITNERVLDGDRAYALSVAADLNALPDHARNMARAQIQHLLENSKITIVKA